MVDLLAHLNHPTETCWPSRSRTTYAPPPALRMSHGSPSDGPDRTAQYHPTSGCIYGQGMNTLQRLQDDKYHGKRQLNMYWPFPDRGEWSLGKFLVENCTQAQINAFLKLAWVSTYIIEVKFSADPPFSFPV